MVDASAGSMAGKRVLVTGGIGKATAVGLAAMGARVGIVGRDISRTRAATADIVTASGNPAVDGFPADLSSQAEVRRLAGEVLATCPRLDVLVNNVAGSGRPAASPPTDWSTPSPSTTLPVPAHRPAPGSAQGQRPGPDRDRVLRRPRPGKHRLRRSPRRAPLLRTAGLQPVQTGQHHVHLRAGAPPRRHRRHRHRAASGRGPHPIRRRGSLADVATSPNAAASRPARAWPAHRLTHSGPPEPPGNGGLLMGNSAADDAARRLAEDVGPVLGPRASAWRMLGASRGPGEVVGHRVRGQPVGMRRFRPRRWGRSSSNPVGSSGRPSPVLKPRTSEPESTSRVSSGGASGSSGSSSPRRRRRCLSVSCLMCRRRSSVPDRRRGAPGATSPVDVGVVVGRWVLRAHGDPEHRS
jgi:short chain dehydrogenase